MAKLQKGDSPKSIELRVKIKNSNTNKGITGLSKDTHGLSISIIKDSEATTTVYSAALIESIAILGVWTAPLSGHVRFAEVDGIHHSGIYALQIEDSRFENCESVIISISGITDQSDCDIEIQTESLLSNIQKWKDVPVLIVAYPVNIPIFVTPSNSQVQILYFVLDVSRASASDVLISAVPEDINESSGDTLITSNPVQPIFVTDHYELSLIKGGKYRIAGSLNGTQFLNKSITVTNENTRALSAYLNQ